MCVDENGNTKLINAINNRNEKEALNIIKNGICYHEIINKDGDNALLLSIHRDLPKVALEILSLKDINVSYVDNYGNTALTLSIKKFQEDVSNKIIELYTDFNINHVDAHSDNALNAALKLGLMNIAQKLVANKDCDFTIVDDNGDTPLLIAINKLGIFNIVNIIKNINLRSFFDLKKLNSSSKLIIRIIEIITAITTDKLLIYSLIMYLFIDFNIYDLIFSLLRK